MNVGEFSIRRIFRGKGDHMTAPVANFSLTTKIVFGNGSLNELPRVGMNFGPRALVVAGKNALSANGTIFRIENLLREAGLLPVVFNEVEPEPSLETVTRGLALARKEQVTWVAGVGGGSAIDAAKAIAGLFNCPKQVGAYFDGAPLESVGIPLVTIPTTAGSGAEVTVNAVLSDPSRRMKQSIRDPRLAAEATIIDPELTLDLPKEVTVNSGWDALVQAIEAYTSKGASPLTDVYAYAAVEQIGPALWQVYQDSHNLAARTAMSLGSLLAGVALTNARLGAVHGLAHAIGVRSGKPHGLICAAMLVPVMRFNMAISYEKYALVARALGNNTCGMDSLDAAASAIKTIMNLQKRMGIPNQIQQLGITEADFQEIVTESLPSGSLKANPREASAEDLINILKGNF